MSFYTGDASSPVRFGTDVASPSDNLGLFLKVFGGEVFGAFAESTIMMDKHYVRSIPSGKSAQFPKTWKADSEYHVAGQEMLGQDISNTEVTITVDGLLVSHVGIYDLDEKMSHFDVRSRYSQELGAALARTFDKNVMRQIILASRVSATAPFPSGGKIDAGDVAGLATPTGIAIWEALRIARLKLLEKNVPESTPVYAVLSPANFDKLKWAKDSDNNFVVANRDFANASVPGTQSLLQKLEVEGITVLRSNLLPNTDESADTSVFPKYRVNASTTLGIVFIPEAVGTVKLIDMGMEMERDARRQEDFIVAKMAVGHGALRYEGAWEIRSDNV